MTPPQKKNLVFFPRQWYLPWLTGGRQTGLRASEAQLLRMRNRGGCLSGGHFVLREQTAPHPTPVSPKEKEGTPCLPSKLLAIPCTGAAPEHCWGQHLVAPGRAGRVKLQPLATLGPRASKSRLRLGSAEANPGQDQPVSPCVLGAAFRRVFVSKQRDKI